MTYFILIFLLGVSFGCVATRILHNIKPVGTLRVDVSDPFDGPYLFLELETDPRFVMQEKRVTLKVDTKSYISQK